MTFASLAWSLPWSASPPPGGAQGSSPLPMLLMFGLIFVIFYLLIIRPQQKRQREHQKMLDDVQNGDRIMTAGGLIGQVVGTKEADGVRILVLKIAENTKVEVSRGHIAQVIQKQH
jgi:preprotein translocase subunit YajC